MTRAYDDDDFIKKEEKVVLTDNLVECDIWKLPEYPLSSIKSYTINVTFSDGTPGFGGSSLDSKSLETFELLECRTIKDAIPFILGFGGYYFSDFPREHAEILKEEWSEKYEIARKAAPFLEKLSNQASLVIGFTALLVWIYVQNSSKDISPERLDNLLESLKGVNEHDRFREIKSASISLVLKEDKAEV
jgi:hypothetical protein